MKKAKILFWVTTLLIFLTQGVMELLTFRTPMAIEGITHLGYPVYFIGIIAAFKVVGSLILIIPKISANIKEWAYAGFGIDFISAFISIWVVDGFNITLLAPVIAMIVLIASYMSYHKLNAYKLGTPIPSIS